jgi:hypothetical protein
VNKLLYVGVGVIVYADGETRRVELTFLFNGLFSTEDEMSKVVGLSTDADRIFVDELE